MAVPSEEIERHAARWARDPKSRVFAQLADAYRKEGFLDEAIEICLQGLKDHPHYVSGRVVLGRAYLEKGELDRAEEEFQKILELDPENIPAYRLLGDIFLQKDRPDEARGCYEAVLRLSPFDREVKELLQTLPAPPTVPPALPAEPKPESPETPPAPPSPAPFPEPAMTGTSSLAVQPPEELTVLPPPPSVEEPQGPALEEAGELPEPLEGIPLSETLADLYVQQGLLDEATTLYRKLLEVDPSKGHLKRKLEALRELQHLHDDLAKARELLVARPLAEEEPREPEGRQGIQEEEPVLAVRSESLQQREERFDPEQRLLAVFEGWLEELKRLKTLRQRSERGVSGPFGSAG